jgi:hypothetical protein
MFIGMLIPEFAGSNKQMLGHMADSEKKNGKSSPVIIGEDESVRIFDRQLPLQGREAGHI